VTATAERHTDVAIVGGGPAGAALAIGLARRGIEATVFERTTATRWRACGVYSSPITRRRLLGLGLERDRLDALVARVPALEIQVAESESTARGTGTTAQAPGTATRLEYERWGSACGIDRVAIDDELLALAELSGAHVVRGATVRAVTPPDTTDSRTFVGLTISTASGPQPWRARVVVGADGPGSLVARSFGVQGRSRWLRRAGITFHVAAPAGFGIAARMVIGQGWYCGLCPVPTDRINIGIVVSENRLRTGLGGGRRPEQLARELLIRISSVGDALATAPVLDSVAVAFPLANRVSHRAGPGFVLVGDACGFLDPISGEGFARALRSAELATDAIARQIERRDSASLGDYDRYLRHRFDRKDAISWLLQAFLSQPDALAYALRRLERRPHLRSTFAAVMADLRPPEAVLDARFLIGLLRP
jgi:flavin-dependent dehydrogenase